MLGLSWQTTLASQMLHSPCFSAAHHLVLRHSFLCSLCFMGLNFTGASKEIIIPISQSLCHFLVEVPSATPLCLHPFPTIVHKLVTSLKPMDIPHQQLVSSVTAEEEHVASPLGGLGACQTEDFLWESGSPGASLGFATVHDGMAFLTRGSPVGTSSAE